MESERRKWKKDKLDEAMRESEGEFFELTKRLYAVVADFGVRALKTFQAAKTEALNPLQINQAVTHEIECVIETLQNPQTADLIIRMAEKTFYELGDKNNIEDIPWEKITEGISLCYDNAKRLFDAGDAYIRSRYIGPGPIPPELCGELIYGSGSGLAILALEEIGKGFFLWKMYEKHEKVSAVEWKKIASGQPAHLSKIELAMELLGCSIDKKQLNEIKQRDIYVDWKDNDWQSPSYPRTMKGTTTDILAMAKKALEALENLLKEKGLPTDPWF